MESILLQVEGKTRNCYDDDAHVRTCMAVFLKHLGAAAEEFSVKCMPHNVIHYERVDSDTFASTYRLNVVLDCDVFQIGFETTFEEKVSGPVAEEVEIKFKITWQNLIVKEANPRYMQYPEGTSELLLNLPKTNTTSILLYTSSARMYQERVKHLDLDKSKKAAAMVVSKLYRIFLINDVHCRPIASIIHPCRKNTGWFDRFDSGMRRYIVRCYYSHTETKNLLETLGREEQQEQF